MGRYVYLLNFYFYFNNASNACAELLPAAIAFPTIVGPVT